MPLRRLKAAKKAADLARAAEHPDDDDEDEELLDEDQDDEEKTQKGDGAKGRKLALSSADRTERRRRQCRISQRRYRDKKGSMEYNLRLDINNLRESVERLREARGLLESKIENDRRVLKQTVLKAVEQYYAMFKYGLHDPEAGAHVRKCYDIQVNFLRAFMDTHVQSPGGLGVDTILEQWQKYTRYHAAIRVELVSAQVFGSDSDSPLVKAIGRLIVTFNRTTLEMLFPHVLADEALTQYLVGREVEYATCSEYMFDEKVQVVRQDFTVDFLSGIGAVLQDAELTAVVLGKAQVAESSFIVEEIKEEVVKQEQEVAGDHEEQKYQIAPSVASMARSRYAHDDEPGSDDDGPSAEQRRRLDLQFIMS